MCTAVIWMLPACAWYVCKQTACYQFQHYNIPVIPHLSIQNIQECRYTVCVLALLWSHSRFRVELYDIWNHILQGCITETGPIPFKLSWSIWVQFLSAKPVRNAIKRGKCDMSCVIMYTRKIISTPNVWFQCTPCASASNYHQTSQYNRISSYTMLHTVHLDENTHIMSFHSWRATVEVSGLFYFCYVYKYKMKQYVSTEQTFYVVPNTFSERTNETAISKWGYSKQVNEALIHNIKNNYRFQELPWKYSLTTLQHV